MTSLHLPLFEYHVLTVVTVGTEECETLLDGGSKLSFVTEDYLCRIVNAAVNKGRILNQLVGHS